ncbi:hypothetical protein D3C81_613140 [compost metagenome]
MERVRVLHQEFTRTHHAETRADFIAELGLNLEEVQRKLLVRADLVADQIGDHFFVRWTQYEWAIAAIDKAQQFRTVLLPTAAFLPQIGRLYYRHANFDRVSIVHFFANDVFNLFQNAQAGRQPGIKTGGKLANHPGAQHQLVADHFGIGRCLLQSGEQILASTHGVLVPLELQIATGCQ